MRFIAAVALTLLPFAAGAADIGLRKSFSPSLPEPTVAAGKDHWTGVYLGVIAGMGSGSIRDGQGASDPTRLELRGSMGGMQVGYNHQIGDYLVGVEGDFSVANLKGSLRGNWVIDRFSVDGRAEGAIQTAGSLRARAGVIMNSALFFATAGYAYGLVKAGGAARVVDTSNGATGDVALSDSKWAGGWTIGAGVEYAFTPQISGKLEYLYADLGKTVPFKGGIGETPIMTRLNLVRGGVNYHF